MITKKVKNMETKLPYDNIKIEEVRLLAPVELLAESNTEDMTIYDGEWEDA